MDKNKEKNGDYDVWMEVKKGRNTKEEKDGEPTNKRQTRKDDEGEKKKEDPIQATNRPSRSTPSTLNLKGIPLSKEK